MTTPTGDGQQGNYGQQPYQQQTPPPSPYGPAGYPPPPQYGAPAYPPQAYGAPVGYGVPGYGAAPAAIARPGIVTAAAVLSFIWGGLSIISSLITMAAGSVLNTASGIFASSDDDEFTSAAVSTSGWGSFFIIVSIVLIVAAGLLIWGGVVALSGKNGKVGVIAGGLLIILQIVSMIVTGFSAVGFAVFGVVVPILIVVFLLSANSKAWFAAKGGQSF